MEKSLPKGWVRTDIEKVADILDNMRKPVSAAERAKRLGEIPYYGATGIAGYIDDFLFDEELVLVGEDGAPFLDKQKNVAFIISGKTWVNNHAHVLRANKFTLNKFLLHYLNQFDYTNFVGGTTRLKLTQGSLKLIPFPLPPLAEQERIVAKLDKLFAQHEKIKKALDRIPELLKNFRQQVLSQAVTGKLTEQWREGKELGEWNDKVLDDVILKIEAGKNFNCPSVPVSEGKVGLVKISAVTWGYFNENETKTVNDPKKIDKRLFIKKGDFLISRANTLELVGTPVIVESIRYDIMLSDKVWRITFNHDTVKWYVRFFLSSKQGRKEIENRATGNQLSMRNISQMNFKKIPILLPSHQEQQEIVRRVESLFAKADAIEARYQKLKERINTLPQAILHKAFNGELVPQLPTDGDAKDLLEEILALKKGVNGKKK